MVLLLTHQLIGSSLLAQTRLHLGDFRGHIEVFEIDPIIDTDEQFDKLVRFVRKQTGVQGSSDLLILTDIYGATPSNLAHRLDTGLETMIIHGLNLPMLVRLWNYHDLSIDELAEKLVSGSRRGIFMGEVPD